MKKNQKQDQCTVYECHGQLVFALNSQKILPENAPVRLASAQLEELDYRKLYCTYSSKGRKSAVEPRVMFKVIVYGYLCGIYSSRKLEEACRYRVDFMWLLEGQDGQLVSVAWYRCEDCDGCPGRSQCCRVKNPTTPKEIVLKKTFWEKRATATENITTLRGIHLRLCRSIQAEGAFALLKNDFGFRRFLTTGKINVWIEMFFLALAFNLKKLWMKREHGRLQTRVSEKMTA